MKQQGRGKVPKQTKHCKFIKKKSGITYPLRKMKNVLISTVVLLFMSTSFLVGQESYLYQSDITPA